MPCFNTQQYTHTLTHIYVPCGPHNKHSLWELTEVSRILLILVVDHMPVGLVGFETLQGPKVKRR